MAIQPELFQKRDVTFITILLANVFILAPLYPHLTFPTFAFAFRSVIFLLFAACLYRLGVNQVFGRLTLQPLFLPLCLVNGLFFVGLFYTPDPYNAITKFTNIFTLTILFLTLLLIPLQQRHWKTLIWALLIGATLASSYALYKQWTGHGELITSMQSTQLYDESIQDELIRSLEANRAIGRFGNPNHLAGYLVIALWGVWYLLQKRPHPNPLPEGEGVNTSTKDGFSLSLRERVGVRGLLNYTLWTRFISSLIGIIMVIGIYQTYSRSGLLVLFVSMILMILFTLMLQGKKIPWKIILFGSGLLLIGLTLLIAFTPLSLLGGRLTHLSTVIARLHFFRGAVKIIQDYPFIGVGPEGFQGYYAQYLRPGDVEARYVHNVVLEFGVEFGLIGVLIFFWILFVFLKYLKLSWKIKSSHQPGVLTLAGLTVSLLLLSLVDFHNNLPEMWLLLIVFSAYISRDYIKKQSVSVIHPLIIGTIITLLIAVWLIFVYARYNNQMARDIAFYHLLENEHHEALQSYEQAVFFDRTDAESWRGLARCWATLQIPGFRAEWLDSLSKAVQWSPRRASLHSDYAEALFALGYINSALEENLKSQQLFPARAVYYDQRARFLDYLGQDQAADEQRQLAEQIRTTIEERKL